MVKEFIFDLKVVNSIQRLIKFLCNNFAAVFFSKNNKNGSKSKHIYIKYLNVRENIKNNAVYIEHTRTYLMLVDPMTKALPVKEFQGHVDHMGPSSVFSLVLLYISQ